jgi:WD40 repeat protein
VWSVESQEVIQSFDRGENKVRAIALSPDGRRLVTIGTDSEYIWQSTQGEETCHLWDTATGDLLEELRFKTSSTESAAMRVDSNIIVTGSASGDIHVMDLTGKPLHLLSGHKHSVNELIFTEDGKTMISASTDQTIRIWDTGTWTTRKTLTAHARSVTSLALSPDGKILASASGQRSYPIAASHSPRIRIWNIETGEQLGYLDGHDSRTSGLAFSPDGHRLVSAHTNTTLLIWDASAITPVGNPP